MTIGDAKRKMVSTLSPRYGDNEARWMARITLEKLTGKSEADLLIHDSDPLSDFLESKVNDITTRLLSGEPLQYILGEAYFHGHWFKVDRSTLIPRPETAHLVDIVIEGAAGRSDLAVTDIGTGCGCIAISLALALKFATVTAIDISADALDVAEENAKLLKAKVNFSLGDILKLKPDGTQQDIIVSNPPYILESETETMDTNVKDHEPSTALFVPDSDPLKFYRPIIEYARESLVNDGLLYLELNPLSADGVKEFARKNGFVETQFYRDIHGTIRFFSAIKP